MLFEDMRGVCHAGKDARDPSEPALIAEALCSSSERIAIDGGGSPTVREGAAPTFSAA